MLLDADDDCLVKLGAELLARAQDVRPDRKFKVILANREFEAWFLASASSLRGYRGLSASLDAPTDPEKPRDCKGWLTAHRVDKLPYKPIPE